MEIERKYKVDPFQLPLQGPSYTLVIRQGYLFTKPNVRVRVASAMMNKSPFIWDSVIEKDKKTNDKILNRNMIVGGKNRISQKSANSIFYFC